MSNSSGITSKLPLAERFIEYYKINGITKQHKLADLVGYPGSIREEKYHDLVLGLALKGYELKLIEGHSKHKISVGLWNSKPYSYFMLVPSESAMQAETKMEAYKKSYYEALKQIEELRKENSNFKRFKKPGKKPLDNKEIVSLIFDEYFKGLSLSGIAKILNNNGYKTKQGNQWHREGVKQVLNNPIYIDMGFVSERNFKAVQEIIKENRNKK